MGRKKINWKADGARFDKFKRHEAFLWGALAALHPKRGVIPPGHPVLMEEYFAGGQMAAQGYINMRADANPTEIVARIKQNRQLLIAELKERNR